MKKFKIICGAVSLLLLECIGSSMSAPTAKAEETNQKTEALQTDNAIARSASIDTTPFINAPSFVYETRSYLFAVKYDWQAGSGGDKLAFSRYKESYYTFYNDSAHYTDIVFPDFSASTDHLLCQPKHFYYRTYNSSTNEYSYDYATSEHSDKSQILYGYYCQYTPDGMFTARAAVDHVATGYDEQFFIWNHNGGTNDYIIATIKYENVCYNIRVKIP